MNTKLLFLFLLLIAGADSQADTFDVMRTRRYNFLTANTGIATPATTAQSHWNSMIKTANRTTLWSGYNYSESRFITLSYIRLNTMAKALKTPNSSLYNNAALKADIISALQWLYINEYNENLPASKMPAPEKGVTMLNWWDYQIGSPTELNDIAVLLYSDLSSTDMDNYMNVINFFSHDFSQCYVSEELGCLGTFTGANRVWISNVIAMRGVLVKSAERVQYASTGLSPVFLYAEPGKDGFHRDGSFIQHQKFAYTGGYGLSLLSTIATELHLLGGTEFYPTDPNLSNVNDWVYNSFAPIIYKGGLMSNTQGREMARPESEEQDKARQAAEAVALLASYASPTDQPKLKGLVKQWISEGPTSLKSSPAYQQLIDEIMNDASIQPNSDLNYAYRQFSNMDRVVQRTPNYAFAISMYSPRTNNYEGGSVENRRGWHIGDGMTYLYTADTAQFNSNYWPTVNSYQLPGTTVASNTTVAAYKSNNKSFVGGASLLDRYGVTGFDFDGVSQLQDGKKSYFMFDGKIVCLGAAIVTSGTTPVETIIENRKLNSDNSNVFSVNGITQRASMPSPVPFLNAKWAHITFPGPSADIGYYFPTPITLNIMRKSNTGSWRDLHSERNATNYTHNYLSFWKNHGINATNTNSDANKYEYVLLPGYSKTATEAFVESPTISVLSNTSGIQAAKDLSSNILGANFWSSTGGALFAEGVSSYLTSNRASSIIMKKSNDTLYVSVSDPTKLNTSGITVNIKEIATSVASKDPQVTVSKLNNITFTVAVNGLTGKSCTVAFKLQAVKKAQNIMFNTLPEKTIGDDDFDAGASSTSGLSITYTSSDTSIAKIENGLIRLVSAGTTVITASQSGDNIYLAAAPVSQSLTIKKSQIISFDPITPKTFGQPDFELSATSTSHLPVSYSISDTSVAMIIDNNVHITGIGNAVITAYQNGDDVYAGATPVEQKLLVVPDDVAPSLVLGLTATVTDSTASLLWSASNDNIGVTSYQIYRDGSLLAKVVDTHFIVSGLLSSVMYSFEIVAIDAAGNRSQPGTILVTTTDTQAPSAPSNLIAQKTNKHQIYLSWLSSVDNVGVAGYNIYQDGLKVGSTPASITNYLVERPKGKTVFVFTIKAFDTVGNLSEESNMDIYKNGNLKAEIPADENSLPWDNLKTESGVVVFPNPSQGQFTVKVNTKEDGNITTRLFSSSGVLLNSISEMKNGPYQKEIAIPGLPAGTYIIIISLNGLATSKTIIIY